MKKIQDLQKGAIFKLAKNEQACINTHGSGTYNTELKKGTVCVIHKKNSKSAYCSLINSGRFSNNFKGVRLSVDITINTKLSERKASAP